jgi:hypothetical protein
MAGQPRYHALPAIAAGAARAGPFLACPDQQDGNGGGTRKPRQRISRRPRGLLCGPSGRHLR